MSNLNGGDHSVNIYSKLLNAQQSKDMRELQISSRIALQDQSGDLKTNKLKASNHQQPVRSCTTLQTQIIKIQVNGET